jgi:hypothetical protein
MKCYSCNQEGLKPHENWPATKILINSTTEIAHVCDPRDKIIFKGKWRGFSYREAGEISLHVEQTHRKYLTSLRELFKSPYAE